MMTNHSKIAAYHRTNVNTRSEPQLLVDLCDRAVVAVDTARGTDDVALRRSSLQKAREIIVFLQDSLSVEVGGAVAINLTRHYTFLNGKLMEAQAAPETADVELLFEKLSELRDTWQEAVRIHLEQEADALQQL